MDARNRGGPCGRNLENRVCGDWPDRGAPDGGSLRETVGWDPAADAGFGGHLGLPAFSEIRVVGTGLETASGHLAWLHGRVFRPGLDSEGMGPCRDRGHHPVHGGVMQQTGSGSNSGKRDKNEVHATTTTSASTSTSHYGVLGTCPTAMAYYEAAANGILDELESGPTKGKVVSVNYMSYLHSYRALITN